MARHCCQKDSFCTCLIYLHSFTAHKKSKKGSDSSKAAFACQADHKSPCKSAWNILVAPQPGQYRPVHTWKRQGRLIPVISTKNKYATPAANQAKQQQKDTISRYLYLKSRLRFIMMADWQISRHRSLRICCIKFNKRI